MQKLVGFISYFHMRAKIGLRECQDLTQDNLRCRRFCPAVRCFMKTIGPEENNLSLAVDVAIRFFSESDRWYLNIELHVGPMSCLGGISIRRHLPFAPEQLKIPYIVSWQARTPSLYFAQVMVAKARLSVFSREEAGKSQLGRAKD